MSKKNEWVTAVAQRRQSSCCKWLFQCKLWSFVLRCGIKELTVLWLSPAQKLHCSHTAGSSLCQYRKHNAIQVMEKLGQYSHHFQIECVCIKSLEEQQFYFFGINNFQDADHLVWLCLSNRSGLLLAVGTVCIILGLILLEPAQLSWSVFVLCRKVWFDATIRWKLVCLFMCVWVCFFHSVCMWFWDVLKWVFARVYSWGYTGCP